MEIFIEKPATLSSFSHRDLVFGVGVNDSSYITGYKSKSGKWYQCPFYRRWKGMLERSCSEKYKENNPSYENCSVCSEWLIFSNFRAWMVIQSWEGKDLDKDILGGGRKEYSPEFCIFIPQALNKLLTDHARFRGVYPQGVYFDKQAGKFKAQCNVNGKLKNLGRFLTVSEAEATYKAFKSDLIRKTAEDYKLEERIYRGLILASERMTA
jgi:hypothetical protein